NYRSDARVELGSDSEGSREDRGPLSLHTGAVMGSSVPVFRRTVLVALVRVVNAIFFLTTSSYCLLTYSSFAYQQFIKPHLVSWLTGFVVWHHLAFWLMLILTAWTLLPELR